MTPKSVDTRSECLERVQGGGLPPPLPPLRWTPSRPTCQNLGFLTQSLEPRPLFQSEPAKTTYPIAGLPMVRLGSFGTVWVWVRGFGAKPREQTRIGSVLAVLRKSLEDGAPFPALTPQIGSVLEVFGRVLAVLRKTFEDGARTPTSSPGGLK